MSRVDCAYYWAIAGFHGTLLEVNSFCKRPDCKELVLDKRSRLYYLTVAEIIYIASHILF